jgi:hypothetical protein
MAPWGGAALRPGQAGRSRGRRPGGGRAAGVAHRRPAGCGRGLVVQIVDSCGRAAGRGGLGGRRNTHAPRNRCPHLPTRCPRPGAVPARTAPGPIMDSVGRRGRVVLRRPRFGAAAVSAPAAASPAFARHAPSAAPPPTCGPDADAVVELRQGARRAAKLAVGLLKEEDAHRVARHARLAVHCILWGGCS